MYDAFLPSALAYKYTRVYKLRGLSEGIGSFCPRSADVPARAGKNALSRVHLNIIVNTCHDLPAPDPSSCGSLQCSICVLRGDLYVSLVSVSPNPALAPTDTMLCSAITVVALSSSSDCGLARAIPLALNCYATVRIHILEHYTPWDCRLLSLSLGARHRHAPRMQTHHRDRNVFSARLYGDTHTPACKCSRVCTFP